MLDNIKKYRILLGSRSPRRRELLSMLGVPFTVTTISSGEEIIPMGLNSMEVAEYLAVKKGDDFISYLKDDELLITADTIVINDNEILGKPENREDAVKMLRSLSGHPHKVATGVSVRTTFRTESFTSVTEVSFAELSEEEIKYYVDRFLPFDKAGAYGIQEWIGGVAVEKIDGSFYNVMGLPIHKLYKLLKSF